MGRATNVVGVNVKVESISLPAYRHVPSASLKPDPLRLVETYTVTLYPGKCRYISFNTRS